MTGRNAGKKLCFNVKKAQCKQVFNIYIMLLIKKHATKASQLKKEENSNTTEK